MKAITVNMKFDKETKNTLVYRELDKGQVLSIPTLYIRKTAFGGPNPICIEVIVIDDDEVLTETT